MVKTVHIVAAILAVFAALYVIGATLGSTFLVSCTSIADEKACWKLSPDYVDSEYCASAQPCLAQPEDQQHNALVSLLMAACTKAKNSGYADAELVKRIEEVSREFTGYEITAEELCENPGTVLAYRSYD